MLSNVQNDVLHTVRFWAKPPNRKPVERKQSSSAFYMDSIIYNCHVSFSSMNISKEEVYPSTDSFVCDKEKLTVVNVKYFLCHS